MGWLEDQINAAGQIMQQREARRARALQSSTPQFDLMPENDLHPDTNRLAFEVKVLRDQVQMYEKRLAYIERHMFGKAQK